MIFYSEFLSPVLCQMPLGTENIKSSIFKTLLLVVYLQYDLTGKMSDIFAAGSSTVFFYFFSLYLVLV